MTDPGKPAPGVGYVWLRNNAVGLLALFVALSGTAVAAQVASNAHSGAGVRAAKKKRGPRGPQGPKGDTGPPGMSHGFQAAGGTGASSVSGSLFGTTVVTVQPPPGNYLVTSTVEADTADGMAGSIQCRLINEGGTGLSSATTRAQDIAASGPAENFTLVGEFAVSAGQSMNLECSRSGASSLVRVNDANIVAVQIADFSGFPE